MLAEMRQLNQATSLTPQPVSAPAIDLQWYVLHTRARHERVVAEQLKQRCFEHMLPLYASVRKWKDRKKLLELPLFPGYIFVQLFLAERFRVLNMHGAVSLLGVRGVATPLAEQDVHWLHTCSSNGHRIEPHPFLRIGQRVRVTSGPFADAEGLLERKKNLYRLVLTVELIQRSVSIEIDASDVAALSK